MLCYATLILFSLALYPHEKTKRRTPRSLTSLSQNAIASMQSMQQEKPKNMIAYERAMGYLFVFVLGSQFLSISNIIVHI
jgi:hypothetical protein